jgi:hypothetical protein
VDAPLLGIYFGKDSYTSSSSGSRLEVYAFIVSVLEMPASLNPVLSASIVALLISALAEQGWGETPIPPGVTQYLLQRGFGSKRRERYKAMLNHLNQLAFNIPAEEERTISGDVHELLQKTKEFGTNAVEATTTLRDDATHVAESAGEVISNISETMRNAAAVSARAADSLTTAAQQAKEIADNARPVVQLLTLVTTGTP